MKPAALVVWMILTLSSEPRVSVKVMPTVLFAGGSVRVTCRVPRHPDNRRLTMVLSEYTSHEVQLDGEASSVTHQFIFGHVPCETELAACVVEDAQHRRFTASERLTVACLP